jgi:imidazolonepropionase-like amidohydrolase
MTILRATSLTLLCVGLLTGCEPGAGKTAYVGAEIFDGTGAPLLLDGVVLVDGAHIEAVGPADSVSIPTGTDVVSLAGKWIIPGLIDGHVHVERWTLRPLLAYGVTSVRDVGGVIDSVFALREETVLGTSLGPRIYTAGAMIDGAPATWPTAIEVTTPTEGRQAIDGLVLRDASLAKLYARIDRPLMEAIIDEARSLHLPVGAHLALVDAVTAAGIGLGTIEHLTGILEASSQEPFRFFRAHQADFFTGWNLTQASWHTVDSVSLQRTADSLSEHDVVLVPTLTLHEAWSHLADSTFVAGLDLSTLPPGVLEAWNVPDLIRRARITADDFDAFQRSRPYQDRFVRMYYRSGGRIVAGTDMPNQLIPPGASLHDELGYLVRAGLLPRDALLAATGGAAHVLGTDSVGVIRAGGVADFVILDANPLADIRNSRRIHRVVFRGRLHDPAELQSGP